MKIFNHYVGPVVWTVILEEPSQSPANSLTKLVDFPVGLADLENFPLQHIP